MGSGWVVARMIGTKGEVALIETPNAEVKSYWATIPPINSYYYYISQQANEKKKLKHTEPHPHATTTNVSQLLKFNQQTSSHTSAMAFVLFPLKLSRMI